MHSPGLRCPSPAFRFGYRRCLVFVGIVVAVLPATALAGTTIMNDLDDAATSLHVTFSEAVTITSFGSSFEHVTPTREASEFTFHGGTIAPMDGFRLDWIPLSAELESYEWDVEVPLTARLRVSSGAEAGRLIAFSAAESEDPGDEIVEYLWSFGDGTTGAGITTVHVYQSPGTYTVRLDVFADEEKSSAASITVPVAAASEPVRAQCESRHVLFDETALGKRAAGSYEEGAGYYNAIGEEAWYGSYDLARRLVEEGYIVSNLTGEKLTPQDLADVDVLVLFSPTVAHTYESTEIAAIEAFVARGGGLLLTAMSWRGSVEPSSGPVPIASAFDIRFKDNGQIHDPSDYSGSSLNAIQVRSWNEHPITHGISEIVIQATCLIGTEGATILAESDSDSWFDTYGEDDWGDDVLQEGEPIGPFPLMAAKLWGDGRIVAAGGTSWSMNVWLDNGDAEQLGVNLIRWLAERPMVDIHFSEPAASGEIEFSAVYLESLHALAALLGREIVAIRDAQPEAVEAAFSDFFTANDDYFGALSDALGMPLEESLPPIIQAAPAEGIQSFFLTIFDMLGEAFLCDIFRTENTLPASAIDFAPLLELLHVAALTTEGSGPSAEEYTWQFGDGGTGIGTALTHRFEQAGTYSVSLAMTNDQGLRVNKSVEVVVQRVSKPPTAHFAWQRLSSADTRLLVEPRTGDGLQFDASASYDPDGGIVEYAWDWDGDGVYDETSSDSRADHWFEEAGEQAVTLRVTDDDGGTDTDVQTIPVLAKQPPQAGFSSTPESPSILDEVTFTDQSVDSDGDIVSWAWAFGDGETSSEQDPTHNYRSKETFTVRLTVTDDDGLTAMAEETLSVVNVLPGVSFNFLPDAPYVGQAVMLDGSASSDSDGAITAYAWNFGDGGTSTGTGPTHEYEQEGTYTITLTVTDDDGATASHEQLVTVAAAPTIIEAQQVWALVIGISDYSDVPDLRYARADAEAFTQWLLAAGVEPDHIRLLLDEETQLEALAGLRAEPATMVKVRAGLGWLRRMAGNDDLVFVFFAGHGYPGEDDNGDEADGVDEFLVLYDTLDWAKEETALRDDEFGEFLDKVESDHVMVVFDSCYAGGQSRSLSSGARPLGDTFDIFNDFSLDGKLILAAAREDQEALEHEGLGHGLFTHFLLQGLEGEADVDLDYRITAAELSTYVGEEVERFAREEMGREQTPEMTGRGQVGIVLGRTNRPPEAAFASYPEIPYAYGETRFDDASTDDTGIVSWAWDLGDGTASEDRNPTHAYEEAGSYTVTLTVTDEGDAVSAIEQDVVVAPPGEVTVVFGDTVVISLGSANGIEVGDRFAVMRLLELSSGAIIEERKATIEVTEILGVDRAACDVRELLFSVEVGDYVKAIAQE